MKPKNISLKFVALAALLLFVVIAVTAYVLFHIGTQNKNAVLQGYENENENRAQEVITVPLSGLLHLTLLQRETSSGKPADIVTSVVDAATNDAFDSSITKTKEGSVNTFFYSFSNDAQAMTFLALNSLEEGWDVYQTSRADVANFQELTEKIEQIEPSAPADDEDFYKIFPAVSNEGTVVYSSLSKQAFMNASSTLEHYTAQEWTIYSVDPSGSKTTLTTGLRPKWINNTQFAFLKNDGVYVFNVESMTEDRVWNAPDEQTIANGFDVSSGGNIFVHSDPEASLVRIAQVSNWNRGELGAIKQLLVSTNNLAISPNNAHLAMVTHENNASLGQSTAHLRYYSLETGEFMAGSKMFNNEQFQSVYLTDWE